MTPCSLDCLRHETRRFLARALARGRLHRFRRTQLAGAEVVLKSRRLGSGVVLVGANLYLRLQRSDVEVLSVREWIRWESAVEAATTHGVVVQNPSPPFKNFRGLVSHVCPGVPLQSLLTDPACSLDEQFAAIRWSLDALHQLHRHHADWGDGIEQCLSHGDATVNNVVINLQAKSATWIDFDTRHHCQLPEPVRRADDCRALICSAASHLPLSSFPRLSAEFLASCPDASTLHQFRHRLATDWRRPNTFQLAQAPLSWIEHTALSQAFLQNPKSHHPPVSKPG